MYAGDVRVSQPQDFSRIVPRPPSSISMDKVIPTQYTGTIVNAVFRIRISFHADPDPGSLKCPYGSGSRPLIFYSDPDPKGVKIKEDNLYKQIFNKIFQNDIKTPLKIRKHNVLQKDPYFYVSSSVFT